jgi:glycosyltransferase
MPAHPTFYVKRRVAEAVGAFDLSLPTAADYDWMLRAIDVHGASLQHIPQVMVDMALGGRSTASLAAHLRHNLEAL